MVGRWVKAVFLAILGLVIAMYGEGLVSDFETAFSDEFDISFEETWTLLTLLIWILVAWLFVLAILTVIMSLKEDLYTLTDVMARLRVIEKRLSPKPAAPVTSYEPEPVVEPLPVIEEEPTPEPAPVEMEPPPPGE